MGAEGGKVDDATRLAIISEIDAKLKDFSEDIKGHIDLRINPIEKDVDRLRGDVADLYEQNRGMMNRVSNLEQRQANDEGDRAASTRSAELGIGKISLIIGAAGLLGGALTKLIP